MAQKIPDLRNLTAKNPLQYLALSMGLILNILKRAQTTSGPGVKQIKFTALLSMVWVTGKVSVGLPVIRQQVHRWASSILSISTIISLSRAR